MMPPEEGDLIGGPQDGSKVRISGGLPLCVYVGPKWLGDGYSAWSRKPSKRFPARYTWAGAGRAYHFDCYKTKPDEQILEEPCQG